MTVKVVSYGGTCAWHLLARTVIIVLGVKRSRLVDTTSEKVRHDVASLAVADENDTAAGAAGGNVVLDLVLGVGDALGHRLWVDPTRTNNGSRVVDGNAGRAGDASGNHVGDDAGLALARSLVGPTGHNHVEARHAADTRLEGSGKRSGSDGREGQSLEHARHIGRMIRERTARHTTGQGTRRGVIPPTYTTKPQLPHISPRDKSRGVSAFSVRLS